MKLNKLSALVMVASSFFAANAIADQTFDTSTQHSTSTSTEQHSDQTITADIKEKFLKEKLFGTTDAKAITIQVETKNGVVHLTGTATNQAQLDSALKLTESVDGVKKVVNEVKLNTSSDIQ
ncbi:BON domain-containing protein [Candidatus Berkiella aquae]|uniref:BON domain-containing protein n=1 Tax=Candidatus Berkiella aquae TaxID=295108 RepID=A0A0Q9YZP8_9GAMM|nr:BON domain-containing protein [Candidatus Berkiella aquae]MCS5711611.1 BON domain-containing protein [Candidatus Berkiella aquae]